MAHTQFREDLVQRFTAPERCCLPEEIGHALPLGIEEAVEHDLFRVVESRRHVERGGVFNPLQQRLGRRIQFIEPLLEPGVLLARFAFGRIEMCLAEGLVVPLWHDLPDMLVPDMEPFLLIDEPLELHLRHEMLKFLDVGIGHRVIFLESVDGDWQEVVSSRAWRNVGKTARQA